MSTNTPNDDKSQNLGAITSCATSSSAARHDSPAAASSSCSMPDDDFSATSFTMVTASTYNTNSSRSTTAGNYSDLPPAKRAKIYSHGQRGKGTQSQNDDEINNEGSEDDNLDGELFDHDIDSGLQHLREATQMEDADFALCCRRCHCSEFKFADTIYRCLYGDCSNSGQGGTEGGNSNLFHRGCCHKEKGGFLSENYKSPMRMALATATERIGRPKKMEQPKPLSHIQTKYNSASRMERAMYNKIDDAAPDSILLSSHEYIRNLQRFMKRKTLQSVKVLDLFSGIAAGIVVLKRLQIPIDTVVHVEHDPVAKFVNWYNHENRQDGINHVYIDEYDDIKGDNEIRALIDDHGPFDIVLAGPPCCDYSGLNAYHKGIDGESGKYLQDCGRLVGMIDEIQKDSKGVKNNVIFLAENVVFFEEEFRNAINESFGTEDPLPPLQLDSQYFGPCRRNRFYWINVPIIENFQRATRESQKASVRHILRENHIMPEEIVAHNNDLSNLKANTFLAATSRIDDARMMKLQEVPAGSGEYISLTFSVTEREQMMGLPVGYVESAVNKLFDTLTMKGIFEPEQRADGTSWRKILPRKFHKFSTKCKFRCKWSENWPYFKIEISCPPNRKPKNNEDFLKLISFYDKEGYCKRLIGNSWSVPTVEYILKALTSDKFCSETKAYEGYDYQFPWSPEETIDI